MTKRNYILNIGIIAVLATLAMASSFYQGITTGNDYRQHFQFTASIHSSIASGELYPGFAAAPNAGLGDIALRFYPPFAYYLLSAVYFLLGNWYVAALATFWLIFFAGGLGAYFLAREELDADTSLVAAAIYTFAPYHLNEIYNNFLYAEFVATAILPFCLLFITRICRHGGWRNAAGLAISYALLILTHLPLTIIGSIIFPIYALFLLKRENFGRSIGYLFASALGGLVLSSWYWVRMVRELDWVKHSSPEYFSDTFAFGQNFLLKPANWINFHDDILNLWLADLMLVAMLAVAVPSAIYLVRHRHNLSGTVKSSAAVFFLAVFMATPLSAFVWKIAPFLQKVQFPWRWLAIVSLCGAIFASVGVSYAAGLMKRSANPLLPISLGLILVVFVFMAAFIIKQAAYVSPAVFHTQTADIRNVRSYEGWWPLWAKDSAFAQNEQVFASGREIEIDSWNSTDRRFRIGAGESGEARVRTFYYPHWKAMVNDVSVNVLPSADGLITIPLAAESSAVRLYFEEPGSNRAVSYVSAAAWVILLASLAISTLSRGRLERN